ncbi:MAG: M24 family metallopeptidase [Candidatus Zixiibacteriota bacterium]
MLVSTDQIQRALADDSLDGWLLYDFHGSNSIAQEIVGPRGIVTRRWYAWIPASGEPVFIHHRMENHQFAHLNGDKRDYLSWKEQDDVLKTTISGAKRIAMEYSPGNAIPYVAKVDAGLIEKLRGWDKEIVSSADLIAQFLARWTEEQVASHHRACKHLGEIKDNAFKLIAEAIRDGKSLNEFDVVTWIRREFDRRGLMTHSGPICAVDANAGSPHYEPTAEKSAPIGPDQVVLLDIWAREKADNMVFADITWMGYTGTEIPDKVRKVFEIVANARDSAIAFANKTLASGKDVHGYEIDDVARKVISDAGYGDKFIHRTGHSIGTDVHGVGPNIDNLETQDQRRLQDGMCFSIEPGIYLDDFGIRLEVDVLIQNNKAVVTTLPLQTELVRVVS